MAEDAAHCEDLMKSFNIKESDLPKEPKPEFDTIVDFQRKDAEFWHLVFDKANYWIDKGFNKEVSHPYSVN